MQKYYEILGVSPEASQNEIKKAYFKRIRQYSPEKDPEKFRELREAYEALKDQEEKGPSFPPLEDRMEQLFLKQILENEKSTDFSLMRDVCEEAVRLFPDKVQFRYHLAIAQRKAGNTGKAVKTSEELVKREPENKWYWKELAMACIERGFTKKAFPAILKAYEMGCRDNDFLLSASLMCNEISQCDTGMKLLFALVEKEKHWSRQEIPEVLEAYTGLCVMEKGSDAGRVLESLERFLMQYSVYLEENMEMLLQVLMTVMLLLEKDNTYTEMIDRIVQHLQNTCRSEENRELISIFVEERKLDRLFNDERIGETIKYGIVPYIEEEMDAEVRTYGILDMKLCMLKEKEEILPQLEIIEKEYLFFYEKISDFVEKLRSGKNLDYMKEALQRQYASLSQYMSDGRYFELYPEEKIRSCGTVFYQDEESQPYVRETKKVGRNDPCPCGSGKKYKHCCGKL